MTWEQFENELRALAEKVNDKPDMIIGITRGGLIPARLLSTYLGVKKMHCLSVAKDGETRSVATAITQDLNGKKILLVEDMLETGRSLIMAKKYLEDKGAEVETTCLYTMPISEIEPNYYLKKIDSIEHFPWE